MERQKGHQASRPRTLLAWMGLLAEQALNNGKLRRAEIWRTTRNSFLRFRSESDLPLAKLDNQIVQDYDLWLDQRGLCRNTRSFYLRNLRSAYNKAVAAGLCSQKDPFRNVYTGIPATPKRALDSSRLQRLARLDLDAKPDLAFARDLFLLSFCLRGMAFVDLASLRRPDLRDGRLTYTRQKTGRCLSIRWEPAMQQHLDDLWRNKTQTAHGPAAMAENRVASPPRPQSPFLLPILHGNEANPRSKYRNALFRVNRALKEIGRRIGLEKDLTLYCARHSWASMARNMNVPLAVISEALGHGSERMTRIYPDSLDLNAVDQANLMLINGL